MIRTIVLTIVVVLGLSLVYAVSCLLYVESDHQVVVQNRKTLYKRILTEGWHVIDQFQQPIAIDWLWKEENRVNGLYSIYIPTQPMDLNLPLIVVHTKCNTKAKINSKISFRIVEPLKAIEYTQPIEYMLVGTSSIVEKVIGEYEYTDLYPMKATIQKRVSTEVSDYMERLGIVCDEFTIEHF